MRGRGLPEHVDLTERALPVVGRSGLRRGWEPSRKHLRRDEPRPPPSGGASLATDERQKKAIKPAGAKLDDLKPVGA